MIRWLPRSLFGQLLLSQAALLLFLTFALSASVPVMLHRTADTYVASQLREDADIVAAVFARPGAAGNDALIDALGPLYEDRWGSRAYRVTSEAGAVLARGGVTSAMPPPLAAGPARDDGFKRAGEIDVFRRAIRFGGTRATLEITQDRTRPDVIVDDVVSTFLRQSLWIIPIISIASAALALLLVRRVVRQLRVVSEEADRIHPGALDTRLSEEGLSLEPRRLAAATNRALDRVEAGFQRQSQFVASVAHELRTPIALAMLRGDALPSSPEHDAMRDAIAQVSHVVSQLMELAAIEGRPPAIEPVSLDAIARGAVEAMAPLVYRSGRSLEMEEGGDAAALAPGNAGLLHIAATNLIDNAVRHTPPGTHISVRATADTITVSDDGPGLIAEPGSEDRPRFRSAGRQRSDGAGLGLTIVARIMETLGGTMTLRPGGPGTAIVLRLGPRGG